jgi:hypothetical protein
MGTVRTLVICLVAGALAILGSIVPGDTVHAAPATQGAQLQQLSTDLARRLEARRTPLYYELLKSSNPVQQRLNANPAIQLMYIRESGAPAYYILENLNAAKTISTDDVWPGGSGGFSLSGSGTSLGELAIWDGGGVLTTHRELTGRVTQKDSPGGTISHATHVAGTMIAQGFSSTAKGMSFQGTLAAYDWNNDTSEMASAAATGMNVSNHSYGFITGWYYDGSSWYWYGDIAISTVEDYGFGFYSVEAQDLDQIAYNAPYYTICKAAGNDRNDTGPGPGGGHYYWNGSNWVWGTTTRDPDGGSDGYDCISWDANAKNILAIGAVNDIPGGWTAPSDVVMTAFSCWGPTDDGRIKPDLVGNGAGLYSCTNTGTSSYTTMSGTSMSSPNVSGSLNLLVRYYEATHGGSTPLSSTMKAVLIQTADEAGPNPGPDYMFGWGLMSTLKAAQIIKADSSEQGRILEETLANGASKEYYITSDGLSPIKVSLAWSDPPGTPPAPSLNPTTPMLVNDLDLRLIRVATSTVYQPYVLNPASPASAASTGDNWRDNSEQIYLASPAAGQYRVTVTHKGTLASAQTFSLASSLPLGAGDTQPPTVTVTAPNGGEAWDIGSTQNITWTATDNIGVTSISILLSRDGGATYTETLATGEANDGVYAWLVTAPVTTTARVKVIAYDAAANSGEDASNANFTIRDGTAPVVTVTAPNGGEAWDIGSIQNITWTATDDVGVTSIDILLSTDGGATYPHMIATGEANDGTYPWLVDGDPTLTARVKVIAYDAASNSAFDVSDADFGIYDPAAGVTEQDIPPRLVVVAGTPNPMVESTRIRFGLPASGRADLEVFDVSGRKVATLPSGLYSEGYHEVEWRPTTGLCGSGIYFLRVRFGHEEVTTKIVIWR